jgi:ribose-phosphate pyrophosphokinase
MFQLSRLVLAMPGNEAMASAIATRLSAGIGTITARRFPDRESLLRLPDPIAGRDVDIVCTLSDPDPAFLRLAFAARTARELGASSVGLVAPYLAYMRQDTRFNPGEAVSARCFAALLSGLFDRIVTVDPHLHRITGLGDIFTIPATVLKAAPLLGAWIKANVAQPLLIGPDSESEQWVAAVAARAGAPYVVLAKRRLGDRDVTIEASDLLGWRDHAPVLVDDMISSGRTLIEAAALLARQGMGRPVCVVVHAVFAKGAHARLKAVSEAIVSTDTIPHDTNRISVAPLLATTIGSKQWGKPLT